MVEVVIWCCVYWLLLCNSVVFQILNYNSNYALNYANIIMLWWFRPTVMLEHNSPRANCPSSLHDLDQISRNGQWSWGTIFLLQISVWGPKFSGPKFSGPKIWWQYQCTALVTMQLQQSWDVTFISWTRISTSFLPVLAMRKELSVCNHCNRTPQIRHHGSQVFLLERIPCLKSWSMCPVMQESMEIKLTIWSSYHQYYRDGPSPCTREE